MAPRRLPNGRFARVIQLAPGRGPSPARSLGGDPIIQIRGNEEAAAVLADARRRVGSTLLRDADERAAFIQQRLRTLTAAAYTKAATGRFSRGLFARAQKVGNAEGGLSTVIRVTMINYRESRFLTSLGGGGYFSGQSYPVPPYRIWAQEAKGASLLARLGRKSNSLRSGRRAIRLIREASGVGRLKVPRRSAFFTAARRPGRGGGESRTISDLAGPMMGDDRASHFFFYPLWVNHPGFPRDVVTDIAIEEGGRFQSEVTGKVTDVIHGTPGAARSFVSRDIPHQSSSSITPTTRVRFPG